MESPDVPWAKRDDARVKSRRADAPCRAALFFMEYLRSSGISSGKMIDIGCGSGRNAIFFAQSGFEVHAVDHSEEVLKDMDLHGVMPHCHNVTDYWLFDDDFFPLAMDILCYGDEPDEKHRISYRRELMRVMRRGGLFLLSVERRISRGRIEDEFSGFEVVA